MQLIILAHADCPRAVVQNSEVVRYSGAVNVLVFIIEIKTFGVPTASYYSYTKCTADKWVGA